MSPFSTIAQFRALPAPDAPTEAELALIDHCCAGTNCTLGDGTLPPPSATDRTIRATLLRLLIMGGTTDCGLHGSGVWLQGAYITGTLDLRFAKGRGQIALIACRFEQVPQLEQASLDQLFLDDSHLPGLFAQGIKVKGNLFVRHLTATGTVVVTEAKIGGQFCCTGATLDGPMPNGKKAKALNAQGVGVGADLVFDNLTATGTVALSGAKIGGQLSCNGAKLDGSGGTALRAQGVEVGADLFLINLTATGTVAVNGAKIGGQLACVGANLDGAGEMALNAQEVEVGAGLFLRNLTATGTASLNGAKIAGQLACEGANLDGAGEMALNGQRMRVTQGFFFRDLKSMKGQINLASAHVGDLVDDLASWPKGEGELYFDGLTYNRISGASTKAQDRLPWLKRGSTFRGTFYPQPYTQLAKVLSEMGHDRDARAVRMAARQVAAEHARALDRATRKTARAFRQVSTTPNKTVFDALTARFAETPGALREALSTLWKKYTLFHLPLPTPANAPPPEAATTLAFARQDFRNQMWATATLCRLRIGWSWVYDQALRRIIGYGYAPERSLVALLVLFLTATTLAHLTWEKGSFAPNSDVILVSPGWLRAEAADCIPTRTPGCDPNPALTWSNDPAGGLDWDSFNRYGYAADLVIPVLDLGQTDAWAPSKDRGPWGWGLWWGRWVLVALGWIVTALGAAAITGIMQRKAPD